MKSTTVRFADQVYRELELASRLTGLPINSIVTMACLDWLRVNLSPHAPLSGTMAMSSPTYAARGLEPRPLRTGPGQLAASDPLWMFTASAQEALGRAQEASERSPQPWIGTGHLLQGLAGVDEGRAARALVLLAVDVPAIAAAAEPEAGAPAGAEPAGRRLPTSSVRTVLRRAEVEAERDRVPQVGTDHLLLGLLLEGSSRVAEALEAAGVTAPAVRSALRGADAEP